MSRSRAGLALLVVVLGLLIVLPLAAAGEPAAADGHNAGIEASHAFEHRMTRLVLEIGIILFAGYAGARLARRIGVPIILGEVVAGIIIGPYLLGSIPLPSYPDGIFAHVGSPFLISPELYGFAVVASIVLLFLMGLETDISLFLRFAVTGSVIGLGGAVLAMGAGILIGVGLLDASPVDPEVLFLGVVAIATSVDITGRILSERHKMASPEGVTILSASVIEDVVGITLLAVVLGIDALGTTGTRQEMTREIVSIATQALVVWLGFTALGLIFARRISAILKGVHSTSQIAVLSLGLAFILAGLFEAAGLAMIIGAYVMGLSLANTDIAYVVQEKIETIHSFFDPIFFTVTGMLINVFVLASGEVILVGLAFAAVAIIAKLVGCGLPSLALGFTPAGAARIAVGLVPRGEVALVIASIGLASGILDDRLFGIAIFMTLVTTLAGPPVLNRMLQRPAVTTRREISQGDNVETRIELGSRELVRFVQNDVLGLMRSEGFFVNAAIGMRGEYNMRKDSVFITMNEEAQALRFVSAQQDVPLINNLAFEAVLSLKQRVSHVASLAEPTELRRAAAAGEGGEPGRAGVNWYRHLPLEGIHLHLRARSKEEAITRLVDSLAAAGRINDRDAALAAVMEREASMSTGMQNGVAIPHGRSDAVKTLTVAVGLVPEGLDFESLDGKPTTLIFLVVSPEDNPGPHLQVLSSIAAMTRGEESRQALLEVPTRADLLQLIATG